MWVTQILLKYFILKYVEKFKSLKCFPYVWWPIVANLNLNINVNSNRIYTMTLYWNLKLKKKNKANSYSCFYFLFCICWVNLLRFVNFILKRFNLCVMDRLNILSIYFKSHFYYLFKKFNFQKPLFFKPSDLSNWYKRFKTNNDLK